MHKLTQTYQTPGVRRCHGLLDRTNSKYFWQSDFRGSIVLEDTSFCWVRVDIATDRRLRLELTPALAKTPIAQSYREPHPSVCVLRRRIHKHHSWESDFCGWLRLEDGRLYCVGVFVRAEQILEIYFRLALGNTPVTAPVALEEVV
jgi:hypothetical protein